MAPVFVSTPGLDHRVPLSHQRSSVLGEGKLYKHRLQAWMQDFVKRGAT